MGDFRVRQIQTSEDRNNYYRAIISDIEILEQLLADGRIEKAQNVIGVEQEMCIIDREGRPNPKSTEILADILDPRYTNEIALFNLEANGDPMRLGSDTLQRMEDHILELMRIGARAADLHESDLLLTGVLPTLKYKHLDFHWMTPEKRYQILSNELLKLRGREFSIHIEGVEELHAKLDSVLFEACNTSFQTHLQVDPDMFDLTYNWAQMISGPVLSICTNSPLLFGRELWHENRIALFKQSLDTRTYSHPVRKFLPRVSFGHEWLRGGPATLWKDLVARFPLLLMGEELAPDGTEAGATPKLRSVRLLTGTTYTWNRLCYGVHKNQPHIRIECRYLPSGPTVQDEIANLAFWVGLMHGMPEEFRDYQQRVSFMDAKANFIRAARTGMRSQFDWFGKCIPAVALIEEHLIPMAAGGLASQGIRDEDIRKYLGIIQQRLRRCTNGSEWLIRNFRKLREKHKPSVCSRTLVHECLLYQKANIPVHEWDDVRLDKYNVKAPFTTIPRIVEDVMNTEVFTINEHASVDLARHIMQWNNFHHVVVEDNQKNLLGVFSYRQLEDIDLEKDIDEPISLFMRGAVITIEPHHTIDSARKMMEKYNIHSLPVLDKGVLVGIITDYDLPERE